MIYVWHFLVEMMGQVVLWLAYKHVCKVEWHRFAIWFLGTMLATVVTVNLVG